MKIRSKDCSFLQAVFDSIREKLTESFTTLTIGAITGCNMPRIGIMHKKDNDLLLCSKSDTLTVWPSEKKLTKTAKENNHQLKGTVHPQKIFFN